MIDGVTCRASLFRTVRGTVEPAANMNPMFFICVGDLLGAYQVDRFSFLRHF